MAKDDERIAGFDHRSQPRGDERATWASAYCIMLARASAASDPGQGSGAFCGRVLVTFIWTVLCVAASSSSKHDGGQLSPRSRHFHPALSARCERSGTETPSLAHFGGM